MAPINTFPWWCNNVAPGTSQQSSRSLSQLTETLPRPQSQVTTLQHHNMCSPPVKRSYQPLLHHSYMSHFNTSHITINIVYTSVAAFQGKDFFKNTSVAAGDCLSRITPPADGSECHIHSHLPSFPIAMVTSSLRCKHTVSQ